MTGSSSMIPTQSLSILRQSLAGRNWLPDDLESVARVQKWLSVAAGEIAYGPCAARLITVFGADFRAEEVIARAHRILTLINQELVRHQFIIGDKPTIADVALYSYIVGAPEGNVDLTPLSGCAAVADPH